MIVGLRLSSLVLAVAAVGTVSACEGPVPGSTPLVRDSAGVRILEVPIEATELTLAPDPLLRIGAVDGEEGQELYQIRTAFVGADGEVFIANAGSSEVRVYDAQGLLTRRIGGPGEGPGEFGSLDWMVSLGSDSLAVLDMNNRRVTAFSSYGDVLWTRQVNAPLALPIEGDFYASSGEIFLLWDSGDVFDLVAAGAAREGETARSSAALYQYSPDGSGEELRGDLLGPEAALTPSSRGSGVAAGPAPWGRGVSYAASGDGVYIGDQEGADIRVLGFDGDLTAIIRLPLVPRPVLESDVESFLQDIVSTLPDNPQARERVRERFSDSPVPPQKPTYGDLFFGSSGRLWVSEPHHLASTPRSWSIIDPISGNHAILRVNNGLDLLWGAEQTVVGKRTDDLGVEYVEVFEIVEVR